MQEGEHHTLKGKTIILTYPESDRDQLPLRLRTAGAEVISMPMIATEPIPFHPQNEISRYNWLVFTSKNGVAAYLASFSFLSGQKIAVLGPATADEVVRHGYQPHFTGQGQTASLFAAELREVIATDEHTLLVLGTLAPDTIEKALADHCRLERINAYRTAMPGKIDAATVRRVEEDQYDVLLISSPSAFRNLVSLLQKNIQNLRIISIGPTTTAAIRERNIEPVATASSPGYGELAGTTIRYLTNQPD